MNIVGVIPSRWASSRFPGKPLVRIGDKSMVQRVYEQASKAISHVVVATDDDRIINGVLKFGGQVVMTGEHHKSGTDRCAEAVNSFEKQIGIKFDIVVNIQGDEPFIQPDQIHNIIQCFNEPKTQIATLVKKITSYDALINPNNPKVVINKNQEAIYFSRSIIPYIMNSPMEEWLTKCNYYEHLGLYAYSREILDQLTTLQPSLLETTESLEQNRWIENGFKIKVAETDYENISIDTVDDLNAILAKGDF